MGKFFRHNTGLGVFAPVLAGPGLNLFSVRHDLKTCLPFFTKSCGPCWSQIRQFILPL